MSDTGTISVSQLEVREGRNLKRPLWGHQRQAIDFCRKVFHKPRPRQLTNPAFSLDGGGVMLAQEMGTGKTLIAQSMAYNLPIDEYPYVLIVCPLRVVPVWPEQIAMDCARKDVRVVALGDDVGSVADKYRLAAQQKEIAKACGERLMLIVNYDSLWRPPLNKWVLQQVWGLTILDECHRIKDPSSQVSAFCARLRDRSVFRLGLTGTPLPHGPMDIYAQYKFLDPTIFGIIYRVFQQEYAVFGDFQNRKIVRYQNEDRLRDRMARIAFRVDKSVLDLPPVQHKREPCEFSPGARKAYDSLEKTFVAEVHNGTITAANAAVKIHKLCQMTGGYCKDSDGIPRLIDEVNTKASMLADILSDIAPDDAVVIFAWFHSDMDAIHAAAEKVGRQSLELSGRPGHDTDLRMWQAGLANVLVVQIQAGGTGIDLTRARYAIYYHHSYRLGDYDQSLSRVHRPGQTRPVTYIHLLVRNSVDEKVMAALEARAEIIDFILKDITTAVAA